MELRHAPLLVVTNQMSSTLPGAYGMHNALGLGHSPWLVVAHETPKRPVQCVEQPVGWRSYYLTELFLDWSFDLFREWTFSLVLKLCDSELYSNFLWWLLYISNHVKPLGKSKLTLASTLPWKACFQRLALDDAHTQRTTNLWLAMSFAVRVLMPFAFGIGPLSWPLLCWTLLSKCWAGCWRNAHTFATESMPSRLSTETDWYHSRMGW